MLIYAILTAYKSQRDLLTFRVKNPNPGVGPRFQEIFTPNQVKFP